MPFARCWSVMPRQHGTHCWRQAQVRGPDLPLLLLCGRCAVPMHGLPFMPHACLRPSGPLACICLRLCGLYSG
jgi:hypothetical protein